MQSTEWDVTRDAQHTTITLADVAREGFLSRYTGGTRKMYDSDLRIFYAWCAAAGVDVLAVRRAHLELFSRHMLDERGNKPQSVKRRLQTLRSFYRLAVADELIDRDPTFMLRMPKAHIDRDAIPWLDRQQMGMLLRAAEATSPAHHALIALMGMLGLRVSEACNVRIEDYAEDELGYRVLHLIGKGGKPATMPVPVPLLRILLVAQGDRTEGPLILRRDGRQQDRNGAYAWVKILAKKAGLPSATRPHLLRHAAVTALVDAGADVWEAKEFARHASSQTTELYYRRKPNLDRHGAHVTARLFASAA